jgi:hypothetical protein
MPFVSKTPKPPYFAVVFTSVNADVDHTEHTAMYQRMLELAQGYEGFLGIEPARNPDGTGVAERPRVDRGVRARSRPYGGQAQGPGNLVQQLLHPHLPGRTRLRPAGLIGVDGAYLGSKAISVPAMVATSVSPSSPHA